MPKLPDGTRIPKSADSPGQVLFNHSTHVEEGSPDCTVCHPKLFPILKSSKRAPIVHERMEKGEQCGACHDGKKAFALDEDCTFCHTGE
jgi:c(7)-type cytochrome triheme protein